MVRDGAAALRSAEEADIWPPGACNRSPLRSPVPLFRQFRILLSLLRGVCSTRQHALLAPGPGDFSSFGNRDFWVHLSTEIRAICLIKERRGRPRWHAGCRGSRRLPLLLSCPPSRVGWGCRRGTWSTRHLSLQFADPNQTTFSGSPGLCPAHAGEESRRILQDSLRYGHLGQVTDFICERYLVWSQFESPSGPLPPRPSHPNRRPAG